MCVSLIAFVSNFIAWYMAGRRTLYVLHLDVPRAMWLAWLEDLVPYISIGGFLLVPSVPEKVIVALCGATGGSLGLGAAMWLEKRRRG